LLEYYFSSNGAGAVKGMVGRLSDCAPGNRHFTRLKLGDSIPIQGPKSAIARQQFPHIRSLDPYLRQSNVEISVAGLPQSVMFDQWANRWHDHSETTEHAKKGWFHHGTDVCHAAPGCHGDDGLHQAQRRIRDSTSGITVRCFKIADSGTVSGASAHPFRNGKSGDFRGAGPRQKAAIARNWLALANLPYGQAHSAFIVAGQHQPNGSDHFPAFAVSQQGMHGSGVEFVTLNTAGILQRILKRVFDAVHLVA
jgi:hypothetical protein